jgi:autotransporter-associated beta strand protein
VNDGTATDDLTITSIISGAGNLDEGRPGTLLASANNTYAGTTSIAAGTFKLGAAGNGTNTPLGTGGATITAGAVLEPNGTR